MITATVRAWVVFDAPNDIFHLQTIFDGPVPLTFDFDHKTGTLKMLAYEETGAEPHGHIFNVARVGRKIPFDLLAKFKLPEHPPTFDPDEKDPYHD